MGEEVRIRITNKQIILFTAIVLIAIASYLIYSYIPKPITSVDYYGSKLIFRQDLREAVKLQVYPDEQILYNELNNPFIKNVTITFQSTQDVSYVALESFEITYKLRISYLNRGMDVSINAAEMDSFYNLNSTAENIFIVLIPPSIANETAVKLDGHTVFISGKEFYQFDLAVVKFLITALGISL